MKSAWPKTGGAELGYKFHHYMRITNFLTKVILQWTGNSKVSNVHGFSSRFVCHKKKVLEFEFDFTFVRFLSRSQCFQTATKKRRKISWICKRLTSKCLKKEVIRDLLVCKFLQNFFTSSFSVDFTVVVVNAPRREEIHQIWQSSAILHVEFLSKVTNNEVHYTNNFNN